MLKHILLVTCLVLAPAQAPIADDASPPEREIGKVLDGLHKAASEADFDAYFAAFAPQAVFLGTDATERWPLDEFKAYAKARFDAGTGWTYVVRTRHVTLGPGGAVAWFDELLENARYGLCRGSGVLLASPDGWKIAQYNLTFVVPNEVALEVVETIRKAG